MWNQEVKNRDGVAGGWIRGVKETEKVTVLLKANTGYQYWQGETASTLSEESSGSEREGTTSPCERDEDSNTRKLTRDEIHFPPVWCLPNPEHRFL